MKKMKFSPPHISFVDKVSVVNALSSGWITRGPRTKKFEELIKNKYDAKGCFCSDSNTACMELALRVLGIGNGDEVITTPYTYSATADVIKNVGADIVFCDLAPNSYEMDYSKVESLITDKTKAIICVDIAGVPCDYLTLKEIIGKRKIYIIADAAHSVNCVDCCKYADFTAFSFHAVKNLTTGEGGALLWNLEDDDLYRRISLLADHGQTSKKDYYKYDIELFGQNHIMTDYCAALGISQFKRIDKIIDKRRKLTRYYIDCLERYGCDYDSVWFDSRSSCHLLMISLHENVDRDEVVKYMYEHGIPVNVHYIPLPMMTAYKNIGFDIRDYPVCYNAFKREITMPLFYDMKKKDVRRIVKTLKKAIDEVIK